MIVLQELQVMAKTYSRKQIHLIKFIRDELLKVPLWGTFFISDTLDRPGIIEAIGLIRKNKLLYKYGFNAELIDGMMFVQKEPIFDYDDSFAEKHDLKLFGRPNYQVYLNFMHKQMLSYKNKLL